MATNFLDLTTTLKFLGAKWPLEKKVNVVPKSSQIAHVLLPKPNRLVLIFQSSGWPTTTKIKKITEWWRCWTRTAIIEAHFIINTMRNAKVKITENDDLTQKHFANLNESFLQILQDYPWTQDGILLVFHLLDLFFHRKSFLCIQHQFFSTKPKQQVVESVHSQHRLHPQTWFQ